MSARFPLADIQFIADFAAFCRSKGDEEYNPEDAETCALAQFGYGGVSVFDCDDRGVPKIAYMAAVHAYGEPYTFSALADRLEALIADAPVVERVS